MGTQHDETKTNKQLLDELSFLREQIADLQRLDNEQKEISDALRKSEEKYRTLLDESSDPIFIINETGGYDYVNKAYAERVRRDPQQILRCRIWDIFHEDYAEHCFSEIKAVLKSGRPKVIEVKEEVGDETRYCLTSIKPLQKEDGSIFSAFCTSKDITEKKRVEEALEQQNRLLAVMNLVAIELASLPSDESLQKFLAKRLKEITNAAAVTFADYDPSDRTIVSRHLEMEPGMLEKIVHKLGKRVDEVRSPVSEEVYNEIIRDVVGTRRTLTEASFGAVPQIISTAIQVMMGIDHFIGIGYVVEGELFGTSLLAIKTGQPDPSTELLRSFGHMAAISLRRRRTEEALHESEAKYRAIVETSNDLIWEVDKKGLFTYVSPKFEKLLGYAQQEILGKSPFDFQPPEEAARQKPLFAEAVNTGASIVGLENRRYTKDGRLLFMELNAVPFFDSKGDLAGFRGINRDITERKRAEEALRLTQFSMDRAADVIIWFKSDGRIVYANEAASHFLGYSREELHSLAIPDIDPNLSREAATNRWKNLKRLGPATFETLHRTKDGRLIQVEVTANYVEFEGKEYCCSFTHDITERKQAEKELRKLLDRQALILRSVPMCLYASESYGDFRATWVSDNVEILTGFKPDQFVNQPGFWFSGIHPDDHERVMQNTNDLLVNGRCNYDYRWKCKDGSYRWFLDQAALVVDEQGKPSEIIGTWLDITDRKAAEEALRTSEERFRIAANIANDLIFERDFKTGRTRFFGDVGMNLGYAPGEFPQMFDTFSDYIHPDDVPHVVEAIINNFQTGTLYRIEYRVRKKDGAYAVWSGGGNLIWDQSGRPLKWVGVATDITERKRAEEALRESEKRYRLLAENVSDVIWTTDLNFKFTYISPSCNDIFGWTAEERLKMPLSAMLTPGALQRVAEILSRESQLIQSQRQDFMKSMTTELEMYRKDGSTIWTEVNGKFLLDERNKPIGVQGVTRDISKRKKAEDALRQSEEQYRLLAENATDIIWTTNMDLKFTYLSPSYTDFFGFSVEEGLTQSMQEKTTPDSFRRAVEVFQDEMMKEETGLMDLQRTRTLELEIRHKNDSTIWVETTVKFLRDAQNRPVGLQGTTRVITERRKAEEALRESERRLKEIMDNMSDMVSITGLDGKFQYVNPAHKTWLGYEPESLLGRTIFDVTHPNDLSEILAKIAAGKETLEAQKAECRLLRADGSYTWLDVIGKFLLDADGNPREMLFSARDISDHKRAEDLLRESEARFRQTFDQLHIGTALVSLDYHYFRVNKALCRILGYSEEEFASLTFIDITHPDHLDADKEHAWMLAAGKIDQYVTDKRYIHKNGDIVYGHLSVSLMKDAAGRALYYLSMIEDITERKRAEEERTKLEAQLRQSQKMESIGRLAGGIAHDFNNLLTGIMGYISLALMDLHPDDPLHATMIEVNNAADSAANLTRQLLAFSRKQIIDPKVIDLNGLISNMHKMLARLIGEDIKLQTIPQKRLRRVKVDAGQFEQILVNLAVNARDAMPDGGTLTIETANVALDETYCQSHPYATPGDYVMLAVSDTGSGMNDEVKQHLFEPFFTTKPKEKGTGLGLATVYGVVKQAGGSIEVYSELGQGTTFKIYLPKVDEKAEPLSKSALSQAMPTGTETILLVEDEPIVKELALRVLKMLGYKVLHFLNAGEALLAAKVYEGEIHILMTDVIMPGVNGKVMAEELKTARPKVKVLFTSGYTEDVIIHHGVLSEGIHFIGKPYTPKTLALKIREVLDGA